jgi:hypothetical protein
MKDFIISLISSESVLSSTRFINVFGAISSTGLLIFDAQARGQLDPTNFGLFLAYCAGAYGLGKALEKPKTTKQNEEEGA